MLFVIVGHEELPIATKHTIEFLVGKRDDIYVISEEEDNNAYQMQFDKLLSEHHDEEIIVFTDLIAGAANQYISKKLKEYDFKLVAGYNIPIILEALFLQKLDNDEIMNIIGLARDGIVYVNNMLGEE